MDEQRAEPAPVAKKYLGVKHRLGPSVYFGPFDSLAELHDFCVANRLSLVACEMVDPRTSRDEW